jgi:D-erythronate 2-dehydrogenase
VDDDVRHWHASPRAAVKFLVQAAAMGGAPLGSRRALTLPGLSCTVGEQLATLRRLGGEKALKLVVRQPDETIRRIVAGWPRNFKATRAEALGFSAEHSFDEIVRAHMEDEPHAIAL